MTKETLNESWAAWRERHGVGNDFEVHPVGTVERLRAELGILSADSAELHRERDALRAEVAELKKANADVNAACCKEAVENDRLRAENEALLVWCANWIWED